MLTLLRVSSRTALIVTVMTAPLARSAVAQVEPREIAQLKLESSAVVTVSAVSDGAVEVMAANVPGAFGGRFDPHSLLVLCDSIDKLAALPARDTPQSESRYSTQMIESHDGDETMTYVRYIGGRSPRSELLLHEQYGVSNSLRLSPSEVRAFVTALRAGAHTAAEMHPVVITQAPSPTKPSAAPVDQPAFEYQIESPAHPRTGNPAPKYPSELESKHVDGFVLAQFVVDTAGRADMSTFKVIRASNDLFAAEVRLVLPLWEFFPATAGGRKLREYVQMPFIFPAPSH